MCLAENVWDFVKVFVGSPPFRQTHVCEVTGIDSSLGSPLP
jgi:hypothetical protein